MIRSMIASGGYEFQLQWEESWVMRDGVRLHNAMLEKMDAEGIDQLSFTGGSGVGDTAAVKVLLPEVKYEPLWSGGPWPLFSLRPGLNRASALETAGEFDESARLWPIQFEYVYGLRWVACGLHKGEFVHPIAIRQEGHISTYK